MAIKTFHSPGRCLALGCGIALLLAYTVFPAGAADPDGALVLITQADSATTATQLLDPHHPTWASIPDQRLQLNRTPPLYLGDPVDDDTRPTATVRLARVAGGAVVLRAHWSDPTEDRAGGGARFQDAGAPRIYRRHTGKTSAFADAFCAMVPLKRGPAAQYPSMMMGEASQPVELYYWRAGVGFQMLSGHGRSTTAPPTPVVAKGSAPSAPQGRAIREGDGWTLTLTLPSMTPGTPICFAIWDGAKAQRDGLKYFSLWYEVQ